MTKEQFLSLKPGDKIVYQWGVVTCASYRGTVKEVGHAAIAVTWHNKTYNPYQLIPLCISDWQLKRYRLDKG